MVFPVFVNTVFIVNELPVNVVIASISRLLPEM